MSPDPRPVQFVTAFDDPAGVYERVAVWVRRGVESAKHPFHQITLANVQGGLPDARTVVLRGFDAAARTVRIHTDARSPKVAAVRADPRACLLLYDHDARLQLRVPAAATAHTGDEVARQAWLASRAESRAIYAVPNGPGEVIAAHAGTEPPPAQAADSPAFERFAVIVCRFDAMDVLELHAGGHRRMRLTWDGDTIRGVRLAP